MAERTVCIAGVAEGPLGKVSDHSELSMMGLAARAALAEAGLTERDVDGLFVRYRTTEPLVEHSVEFGEYMGIRPRFADSTDIGGCSFEAFVHHALLAVAAGRCEVALDHLRLPPAESPKSLHAHGARRLQPVRAVRGAVRHLSPIGQYALIAARHMHQYGTTAAQMAEVAVAARRWAQLNPKAFVRDSLSIDDVLASEMVSSPLRRLDCCLMTDGSAALVVTTADRGRDAAKRPVRMLGAGESHSHWHISQMPDLTVSPGVVSGREAFGMAGIRPSEVDFSSPTTTSRAR